MKKKGIDDALIQPYSGHDSRQSLEMYSKLTLSDCQPEYEKRLKTLQFSKANVPNIIIISYKNKQI